MTARRDFLFEIGTEELPPRALRRLSEAFGEALAQGLRKARFDFGGIRIYATPRRIATVVEQLSEAQPDTVEERRGPALLAAFDGNGTPSKAAIGFARSCGVEVDALEKLETDKGAWLVFRAAQRGKPVQAVLPTLVADALAALPIPRRMRWGALEESFVRPVHWLLMLYGEEIVPCSLFGLTSGRLSRGHRFHHPDEISVSDPAAYAPLLETEGRVIPEFAERREAIRAQVMEAAQALGAQAELDAALLDEVTAMVEWPCAVVGRFEERFLQVPEEALISVMKEHQKYFHLRDGEGRLMPAFITISNIESRDPAVVRAGNERVIRPRLSDAMFFWNQDRKRPLADRLDGLRQVVFQRGLGSLYDKAERVAALARIIADETGGNAQWAVRAARLAKCDLTTDMVGEFPELQGIMGSYYAHHDGEVDEVARALTEQYQPRAAGDELPVSATGQALAIADKLDTVVGIFGLGMIPSGDKDPFALRRSALGVVRIMIERHLDLDLPALIDAALGGYRNQDAPIRHEDELKAQAYTFTMERLRAYYQDNEIGSEVFEAVISRRPARPVDFDARIRAVQHFRGLPEAASLAAANKRIGNILRKTSEPVPGEMNVSLLQDQAERGLADAVQGLKGIVASLAAEGQYTDVLGRLAGLRAVVDTFFDEVHVMCEDEAVRRNRLALLRDLQQLFLQVADLSCLSGQGDPRGQ